MVFDSKVGAFYYVTIMFAAAILGFAGWTVMKKAGVAGLVPVVIAALPGLGIPLWLLFTTYYVVTDDKLLINAAWIHMEIPRSDIRSITPSKSGLSSPALSLDRLDIRYGNGQSVLVSPADKDGFVAALGFPPARE